MFVPFSFMTGNLSITVNIKIEEQKRRGEEEKM
jgi:hypothetical protein